MKAFKITLGIFLISFAIYSCKKSSSGLSLGSMSLNLTVGSTQKSYALLTNAEYNHNKDTLIIKGAEADNDKGQTLLIECNGFKVANATYEAGSQPNDARKTMQFLYTDSGKIYQANGFLGSSGQLVISNITDAYVQGSFSFTARNATGDTIIFKKASGNFNASIAVAK